MFLKVISSHDTEIVHNRYSRCFANCAFFYNTAVLTITGCGIEI